MNQNEQDNKPERTAMQQLIDFINEIRNSERGKGPHPDYSIEEKAIELRDTVEKSQIIAGYVQGWNDRGEDDGDFAQYEEPEDYYNHKYTNYGK